MNLDALYEIIRDTTSEYRKGEEVTVTERNGVQVMDVYAMPHVDEAADVVRVDVHFMVVGIDKAKAEEHAGGLAEVLAGYPQLDRLKQGPSYIEVGAEIGDQGTALRLFALGEALGMWQVITPARLGIKEPDLANQMAGAGYVMISGWSPENPRPHLTRTATTGETPESP